MTDSRRNLIDKIFSGALDRPASERDAYVDDQCGDDLELRCDVLELIDAAITGDDVLEARFAEARDRLLRSVFDDDTGEDLSGRTIDHWRLEQRLARGGLSTVYVAHRHDGEFDQKAAFKVLRRGLDTDDLISRFRAERQILSTLDHPAIARILDGGALDDGRPYLVMEFVEGVAITDYCVREGLGVRDKVVLLIEVLRALHHAHTHLVVHRDVKPSNILVSTEGNIALLDFGIAKILDPASVPGASTMTRTGVALLTPGYGSPEQRAGGTVTTVSDIYQCGLVLYELLTGERPFATTPDPADTSLLPSSRLKGTACFRSVRGDLDAIVRKATHADPARRYSSADEMSADLERYLDGLPVIAQPDSLGYRFSKFVRRRPWTIPVVAIVVSGIAAYMATLTIYSQRLAREQELAAASQQFLIDLFRSPDPFAPAHTERGSEITVVEALGIGRQRIDSELADQPILKASLLGTISEVYASLDVNADALELRQSALEIERSLYGGQSPQVIASLRALADIHRKSGNLETAAELASRQLELARIAFAPGSPEFGLAEIAAGLHAHYSGQIDEGRAFFAAGLAKLRPESTRYARQIIGALIVSAELYGMGSQEQALSAIDEARAIAVEVYGADSLLAASVKVRLASTFTIYGEYERSEQLFLEVLPVLERYLGTDHGSTLVALNNFGYLYSRKGDQENAITIYRDLMTRQVRLYGADSRQVGETYQNLGGALTKLGRYDESLPMHRRAYEIFREVYADEHYVIAFPLLSSAYIHLQKGDPASAELLASEALTRFERSVPGTFFEGVARCLMGLSLERRGRTTEGAALILESHELMKIGSIPDPYPEICRLPRS